MALIPLVLLPAKLCFRQPKKEKLFSPPSFLSLTHDPHSDHLGPQTRSQASRPHGSKGYGGCRVAINTHRLEVVLPKREEGNGEADGDALGSSMPYWLDHDG